MNSQPNQPERTKRSRTLLKILLGYLFFSLVVLTFFVGYFFGSYRPNSISGAKVITQILGQADEFVEDKSIDFTLFWSVWDYIDEQFIDQPFNERQAFYGALKGIVASIDDPYSVFLDPDEAKEFDIEISGQFEGIGAEIGIKDEQLVIIAPLSGSPAEKSGLLAGDAILKIDGLDTYGLSVDQAVQMIRGEKGTDVALNIVHENSSEPLDIKVTRDTITTLSVEWETLENNIAYVEITSFSNDTVEQFSEAVNNILLDQPNGLILDLRNNPGGYLDVAVDVAGEFIEDDLVVTEQFSNDKKQEYYSDGLNRLKGLPLVVLVGPGTASAAEILAGALQDYNLATLVGQNTFGKGSVQDYTEFEDGSSLKLTVAHWLTPQGRFITDTGIAPDNVVEYSYEDYQAGIDPPLDRAIEILIEP